MIDYPTRNTAEQMQKKARRLAEGGQLLEAFRCYSQAEKLFRKAYPSPGDRVFFTQQLALQCLEQLLEDDPGLRQQYLKEVRRFLNEWSENAIRRYLTTRRQQEALWFRESRVNTFQSSNLFAAVTLEVNRKNYDKARELLEHLIHAVAETEGPERDALLAMAKARRESLRALTEFEKSKCDRDLDVVTDAYYRAARQLRLGRKSVSLQIDRVKALRYFNISLARKYAAVSSLLRAEHQQQRADESLAQAVKYYSRAVANAEKADSLCSAAVPRIHLPIVRYSAATTSIRWSIVRIMNGIEAGFNDALQAWKEALEIAKEVCSTDESVLFPNRYYSLEDLRCERHFILAARAFRNRSLKDCIQHLETLIDEYPPDFRYSWRWWNFTLRLLSVQLLDLVRDDADTYKIDEMRTKLNNFVEKAPAGNAATFIANLANAASEVADETFLSNQMAALDSYFALDSQTEFEGVERRDLFDSLPPRLARYFKIPAPATKAEIEEYRASLLAGLEALLGYIYDYNSARTGAEPAEAKLGWRGLLDKCRSLEWAKKNETKEILSQIEDSVGQLESPCELEEFNETSDHAAVYIRKVVKMMPLLAQIQSEIGEASNFQGSAITHRAKNPYPETEQDPAITIETAKTEDLPILPGLYYLPPAWRLGTRLYYRIDPSRNQPLLPVRFNPRFNYWRRQAASTFSSTPRQLLERAVELAEQCELEKDDAPKVGALIVKDGKIVAEASRNEEYENRRDHGMHAEELAFAKAGKSDLSGATLITTLEPCVTGRSNHNTPCCQQALLKNIGRVVIGCLDPDKRISGKGEILLELNNVPVDRFPQDLRDKLWDINSGFVNKKFPTRGVKTLG